AQLRPKKSWGQNFLRDTHVHQRIAAAAGPLVGQTVLELGAGLGALTGHLRQAGAQVIAVERDRELVPLLRQTFADEPRLTVMEADAKGLDLAALAAAHGPLRVFGNLPYQLSSRILVHLAGACGAVHTAVVLVQREVAERAAAPPGTQAGLLSILLQRRFSVEALFEVPPRAFYPAPKVCSTVLRLRARPPVAAPDAALVWVARAAYAGRRKALRNTLAHACGVSKDAMAALCRSCELDPLARPESLDVAAFARLTCAMQAAGCGP
ncbi:MAG: ribosomal RNA small subunit methyltransferase A, partial [Deltaproteobacteria bacterium]